MSSSPSFRKLRGYAFDPSLSLRVNTALINNITYKIPWEEAAKDETLPGLKPGPRGEYIEVIDYDPTVRKYYAPVDLNDPHLLAQDGLAPSGSNPQFHQQMVYAVAMTTIKNFEAGLGRVVLWAPRKVRIKAKLRSGPNKGQEIEKPKDAYVPVLRVYPHAMRDANAYYSPSKKALLFGYFAARPANATLQMPNNLTFTCLSHDVIAHETTHAILDGLHHKYTEDTNPDVLAFHEAFADIVALFQHFTFPDVLKNQIAATRGDLASQNLLGKLAQEFGIAIGNYGALRDAIGSFDANGEWSPRVPTGNEYSTIMEPHARGSILVSAVFDAFMNIYKARVADLLRIASNGTGILQQGELHPDLVNRLASEASKASRHILNMCIRALDYCPPVDINFGDFLRAIITADRELVAEDAFDYRLAFIEAFSKRGIYPAGIKHLSVESLSYSPPATVGLESKFEVLSTFLREYRQAVLYAETRKEVFDKNIDYIAGNYDDKENPIYGLHRRLSNKFAGATAFMKLTGMMFSADRPNAEWENLGIPTSDAYRMVSPSFAVPSLHLASRVGPGGNKSNQIIVTLTQRAEIDLTKNEQGQLAFTPAIKSEKAFVINGGCTLIFDLDSLKLKYAISKPLLDTDALSKDKFDLNWGRLRAIYNYQRGDSAGHDSQFQAYFGMSRQNTTNEPFNFLHNH